MKLLIAGSRGIADFDLAPYVPADTDLIISGGARGVDTLAEIYAAAHGISKLVLRPRYDRYGKAAPLKRNECMVDLADQVLIVWDGVSRGALYTMEYAQKMQKSVTVVRCEKHSPIH